MCSLGGRGVWGRMDTCISMAESLSCSSGTITTLLISYAYEVTFQFHALEKEVATHSSVLAWRIPGVAEPGGLPSMPHSEYHGQRSLVGSSPWGRQAPLSMGFSRQVHWSGLPLPSPMHETEK